MHHILSQFKINAFLTANMFCFLQSLQKPMIIFTADKDVGEIVEKVWTDKLEIVANLIIACGVTSQ